MVQKPCVAFACIAQGPSPGSMKPGFSARVLVGCASLDQSHSMLAGSLALLGTAGLPRLVQEVWLWVEARRCWLVLMET